ncbi:probable cell-surface antigen I/II [Patella vulgata]|uniref:probable cell-surface antigen I/II n=1 Tax=Patella vulgata TaxID=6465 RepID=UPI00217F7022|nr:probable cell-surface antigen I/II [Patella vulgata]
MRNFQVTVCMVLISTVFSNSIDIRHRAKRQAIYPYSYGGYVATAANPAAQRYPTNVNAAQYATSVGNPANLYTSYSSMATNQAPQTVNVQQYLSNVNQAQPQANFAYLNYATTGNAAAQTTANAAAVNAQANNAGGGKQQTNKNNAATASNVQQATAVNSNVNTAANMQQVQANVVASANQQAPTGTTYVYNNAAANPGQYLANAALANYVAAVTATNQGVSTYANVAGATNTANQQVNGANAANQQVNAANRQVNAVNQQVNAANQQVNAVNQQVNAANQQVNSVNYAAVVRNAAGNQQSSSAVTAGQPSYTSYANVPVNPLMAYVAYASPNTAVTSSNAARNTV